MINPDQINTRRNEYLNRAGIDQQVKRNQDGLLTNQFAKDTADITGGSREVKKEEVAQTLAGAKTVAASVLAPTPEATPAGKELPVLFAGIPSDVYAMYDPKEAQVTPFTVSDNLSSKEQLAVARNWSRENGAAGGVSVNTTLPQDLATHAFWNKLTERADAELLQTLMSRPDEKAAHIAIFKEVDARVESARAAGQEVSESQIQQWRAEALLKGARSGSISREVALPALNVLKAYKQGNRAEAMTYLKGGNQPPAQLQQFIPGLPVRVAAADPATLQAMAAAKGQPTPGLAQADSRQPLTGDAFSAAQAGGLPAAGGPDQATKMQMEAMRQSDYNAAMTTATQIMADAQKAEAQRRQLIYQTNQDIWNILMGITANKAKSILAMNQVWDKYIQS